MKKNFKTLLCASAILGSMSAGVVFADDLSIFEGQTVTNDTSSSYENVNNQGTLVNSVGAGDSMVAGFLAGYLETNDYSKAFINGLCCGSASAFQVGLATKEDVENIKKTLSEN